MLPFAVKLLERIVYLAVRYPSLPVLPEGHSPWVFISSTPQKWFFSRAPRTSKEYYSVIKKNEILPFAATWMDLEGIMLSDINQTETDKYYMISLLHGI